MIETNLQTHALTQPGLSANGSKDVSWKDGQFFWFDILHLFQSSIVLERRLYLFMKLYKSTKLSRFEGIQAMMIYSNP